MASGWGDGRVASGVFASTGNVISFGRDNSGSPVANSGVGESTIQANLTSTTSGDAATKIYFAGGSQAFGANPFLIATGAVAATAPLYKELTAATDFVVWAKGAANDTSTSGGCLLYTSPSPRDQRGSRMPSSA